MFYTSMEGPRGVAYYCSIYTSESVSIFSAHVVNSCYFLTALFGTMILSYDAEIC